MVPRFLFKYLTVREGRKVSRGSGRSGSLFTPDVILRIKEVSLFGTRPYNSLKACGKRYAPGDRAAIYIPRVLAEP